MLQPASLVSSLHPTSLEHHRDTMHTRLFAQQTGSFLVTRTANSCSCSERVWMLLCGCKLLHHCAVFLQWRQRQESTSSHCPLGSEHLPGRSAPSVPLPQRDPKSLYSPFLPLLRDCRDDSKPAALLQCAGLRLH